MNLIEPNFVERDRIQMECTTRVPPRGKDLRPADGGRRPASNRGVVERRKMLFEFEFVGDAVPRHEEEGDGVDVVAGEEGVGRVNAQGS